MGSGMARRLLTAGFPVTVFNRDQAKATALESAGAKVAASPSAAAPGAGVLISMVADDNASRSVWLGDQGALAGVARGTILIEASTLTVDWVRALAREAEARGCELLDAPVTGSKVHAASGELNFLVGGAPSALESARPVLAAMSRSITHIGPSGSGALLKLINNFLCGIQGAALAEALALIEKGGLDRTRALDVLTGGAPGSPLIKTLLGRISAGDYSPNFRLALMAKDLAYSLKEGGRHGLDFPMVAAALREYQQAMAAGHGDKDFAAVAGLPRAR
jgi:3-hydroxyisobutyrate dehydrogenase